MIKMDNIKILIADDHPMFLKGLKSILETQDDFKELLEATDGLEAVKIAKANAPDVIIMDITMPDLNGIDATKEILAFASETKIIALSIHSGKRFVKDMLNAGAVGYLLKDSAPEELIKAIRKVLKGDTYLDSTIISTALSKDDDPDEAKKQNILFTKLHRPLVASNYIVRTKITDLLENNIEKPFSLVTAPAGYGKSIVVSQWLEKSKYLHSWISLGAEHNDFQLFILYLQAAIEKIFPGSLKETNSLISGSELPSLKVISNTLINEIDQIKQNFILVLDDYHLINEKKIHQLINELLLFPPEHLHLSIITRRDPQLSINTLRLQNRMTEVRMKDLCLTDIEIADLFEKLLHISLKTETIKSLSEKTEGWIVGLVLASHAISELENADETLNNLKGDFHLVSEFLISELLSKQTPEVQSQLLISSLLDRFCSELLETLFLSKDSNSDKIINGNEFIQKLNQSNLFIVSLDNEKKWFRYHHLFQELLQKQLKQKFKPEEINYYYLIAAKWFKENNNLEEAVQYAILAKDIDFAIRIIIENRYSLMNNEQWNRLMRMMDSLPRETIEANPILLSTQAFYHDYKAQMSDCFRVLSKLELLNNNLSPKSLNYEIIKAEYHTLKAEYYIIVSDPENAVISSEKALNFLPKEAIYIKTFAMYWYVYSHQMTNNSEKGIERINKALSNPDDFDIKAHSKLHITLCGSYLMDGNLEMIKKSALLSLSLGKKYNLQESISLSYYYLTNYHYQRNELNEAIKYIKEINKNSSNTRPFYLTLSNICHSLIEFSKGQYNKSWKIVQEIEDFTKEYNDLTGIDTISCFKVDLAILQGDIDLATQLNQDLNFEFPPLWLNYHRQLVEVKAFISTMEFDKANKRITELIEYGKSVNNINFLIPALALKAIILWHQKEMDQSFKILSESLKLAQPAKYIRTYLDLGKPMLELLLEYKKGIKENSYVEELINSFSEQKDLIVEKNKLILKSIPTDKKSLSTRELEVLTLLADGLRNKEIAAKIYVSEETVKKHLYNVYQKMGVNNRIKVVQLAKESGIISD